MKIEPKPNDIGMAGMLVDHMIEADEAEGIRPAPPAAQRRLDYLAQVYAEATRRYEDADAVRKEAIVIRDRATAELFDAMEQLGLRSVRTAALGTFSLNDLADAKIEDPAAFVEWAKANAPEILHPNFMRLSRLVRDALKGDYVFPGITTELPPGVTFATRRGITWRGRNR